MALNSVIIIGRLTKDVELKNADDTAKCVGRFSVALDRGKNRDGGDMGTDFPNVVCFGKTAENCAKFLKKGRLVAVQGRIRTGSYENKNGDKVYTTDIYADRVEFLEWGNKDDDREEQQSIPTGFAKLTDDDIPF